MISTNSLSTTKKDKQQGLLKNKEANFLATMERFPETKTMINMRLKDAAYKDPNDQMDPHRPSRMMNDDVIQR